MRQKPKSATGAVNRRDFIKVGTLGAGILAIGGATQAYGSARQTESEASQGARFKISCAAYSYRKYLKTGEMTLDDFIDECIGMGLDAVELTSYYFPEKITPQYLNHLKHKTFINGLDISGTAIQNNFCVPPGEARDRDILHVKKWIDYAADFSAPCIRIFAGNVPDSISEEQAIDWCADCIKICLDHAEIRGVFLALENHGGITARAATMVKICDKVGNHPWFGINLDTGNFRTDPYGDMALVAPRVITVQVKDWVTAPDGNTQEADFKKVLDVLRAAKYRGYLAFEYEGTEDPLTGVPKWIKRLRVEAGK
ncbi:sugar phosphate isomerase/epimerase [candidate division KSB1 bacterium]|nr:sugar phosphate isomerase/epimerase [candidate division KSB1 bacterium]